MKKSTSIHSLSADRGLSVCGKLRWLTLNAVNNSFPGTAVDEDITQVDFIVNDLDSEWDACDKLVSPARKLSNLFWGHLPFQAIRESLGGTIKALEVGCGSGTYGEYLNRLLDGRLHYRGLDIVSHPKWDSYVGRDNYEFLKVDSVNVRQYLEDRNFIFTQSALEHFDQDLTFFSQVADFARSARSALFQVHLVPSASCITTYPWHGIRQYTPRNISKITRLFPQGTRKSLYRLGSTRCNRLHRSWITIPNYLKEYDRRKRDLPSYDRELRRAIQIDMDRPKANDICFYALVLQNGVSVL